jgi:hypothetical protein
MFYQGPVINPAVEANIAVGGRILSDTRRSAEDALSEVIALYYRPRDLAARKRLVDVFFRAEDAYFGRWDPARFAAAGRAMPGELHLTDLFGTAPGPATYLMEPYLNVDARRGYKERLIALLPDLAGLEARCDDGGRLTRIQKAITVTLTVLDSIRAAKKES